MIVLVPISRFRVPFATAQGRPYSHLEQLVCRAVGDGVATIDALVDTFKVHRRLITQAVVSLVQDDFVALGGAAEDALLLTRLGAEAVDRGTLTKTIVTPSRTIVVMERLTGALAPNAEVRFLDDRQVRETYNDAPKLPIRVGYNDLDSAQVRDLLPHRQFEWLQFVGTITQLSKGTHWLPVDADLEAGAVIGIPDRWDRRLSAAIPEELRRSGRATERVPAPQPLRPQRRRPTSTSDDPEIPRLPADHWAVELDAVDLITDVGSARDAVASALRMAKTTALIATPAISAPGLETLADDVSAACRRGVRVDVLWGTDLDGGLDRLKKLQYDEQLGATLDFNREPAPTAMSAVVADDGGSAVAIVGPVGPLDTVAADGDATMAVLIRTPGAAAAICMAAAGAWGIPTGERLASGPDRLHRLSAELASRELGHDAPRGADQVRLILDREHDVLLGQVLRTASRRLVIVSRQPTAVAPSRLVELLSHPRSEPFDVSVVVGAASTDAAITNQLQGILAALGTELCLRPGNARALVADDRAVIGSFDPLATESYDAARGLRHVSLEFFGAAAADAIASRLADR